MALALSERDLKRLTAAQDLLLSVDAARSVSTWCRDVVVSVGRLLRSDRVVLVLPHFAAIEMECSPGMSRFLDPVRGVLEGAEPGANRYSEAQIEGSQALRRKLGLEVWTNRMLEELDGRRMEDTGWYYHEFIRPAGVAEGGGLTVQLRRGEAMLLVTPGQPDRKPFGGDWPRLAGLLLPAFKAAARHLQQRSIRRDPLLRACDALDRPVWLWGDVARERHRSRALRRILEAEPDGERLVDEARALVRSMVALRAGPTKSRPSVPVTGERDVRLASGSFRLRALFLDPTLLGSDDLVLVEVESLTPRLPTARAVERRWGLTPRQAEVALLLADGASNREVAETLGISRHTVRSHTEAIFQKLDVHTRKALALHFLSSGARPG